MNHVRANEITSYFGFSLTHDLGKYLKVPFHHNRVTTNSFSHVTERLMQKLSSWKASYLSLAGRLVLCKSVISTMPTYVMQTSLVPSEVCDKLDTICWRFLWVIRWKGKKLHLVVWPRVF